MPCFKFLNMKIVPASVGKPSITHNSNHLNGLDVLDDFSLMIIFDLLDVSDLMKIATLSPRFHQLTLDHYITAKYHIEEHEIFLYLRITVIMEYEMGDILHSPIADQYEDVLTVLQLFGHIFKRLNIQIYSRGCKYAEETQSLVNKYCSSAFQKITIHNYHALQCPVNVNISYPNATHVVLNDHDDYFPVDRFRLDVAFPQMQHLAVDCRIALHNHYPHLIEALFGKNYGHPHYLAPELSVFIRLNPQLRRIKTPAFNIATYLPNLSDLPHLEYLSLGLLWKSDYNIFAPSIARFKHLKQFSLNVDEYSMVSGNMLPQELLSSMQFDRLESFTVYSRNPTNPDFLIAMMAKNTQLQNVTINSEFSFNNLSNLIQALPQLKELNIIWHKQFFGVILNQFLEHVILSNLSLEQFSISISGYNAMNYEDLLEFVPPGWNVMDSRCTPKLLQLQRLN